MENQNYDQNGQSNYQDYTAQYANAGDQNMSGNKGNGTNGLQIASLILGIIGILTCCCYGVVGLILGIIGLVCAIIGNKRTRSGVGVAGLVCSIIAIILGIAGTIYFALIYAGLYMGSGPFVDYLQDYSNLLKQY